MLHKVRRILLLLLLPLAAMGAYAVWRLYDVHVMVTLHSQPDPPSVPPTARTPEYLRVLFIGNSFTNFDGGQALILTHLAQSAREPHLPIAEQVTFNGQSLKYHWIHGQARRRIKEGNWDYVVLQEFSTGPIRNKAEMYQYARLFDQEIRAAGARTLFYMTWADKDKPRNQAVLADAYQGIARELGAEVAPAGLAWQNAMKLKPTLNLYEHDNKHPNSRGAYLTACVFYRFFYGRNTRGLEHVIPGPKRNVLDVSDTDAAFLQDVANQTVTTFARYHPTTAPSTVPTTNLIMPNVASRESGPGPGGER